MGDGNLDFGRGMSVGVRAIASPRSTDASRSLSGTARLLSSSAAALETSVSCPSSRGGGGGSDRAKLCEATVGWTSGMTLFSHVEARGNGPLATYM